MKRYERSRAGFMILPSSSRSRFLSWKFSAWLDYMYERCRQLHYLHFKLLYVDGTKPSNITQIERIFLCPAPPQQAACYKWSE